VRRFFPGQPKRVNAGARAPHARNPPPAGNDATVRIWTTADGKQAATCQGHAGPVLGVAFSANAQVLASTGADQTLRIWNAANGQAVAVVGAHTGPASAVAIHPNNAQVFTAGHDGTAKFWQLPIPASRGLAAPHGDQVAAI